MAKGNIVRIHDFLDIFALATKQNKRRLYLYIMHRLKRFTGYYRLRTPCRPWEKSGQTLPLQTFPTIKPEAIKPLISDHQSVLAKADRMLAGEFLYFGTHWYPKPQNWHTSPLTQKAADPSVHWSLLKDFNPELGDIRWIWEASRFSWAFDLARAYVVSNDEKYVQQFWSWLEEWRTQNPPHQGVNWRCGQECSLRLITLIWSNHVFHQATSTTQERKELLADTVIQLAERIEVSLGYAIAQYNNHSLSEALALYLAGIELKGIHPRASHWRIRGYKQLLQEIHSQFFADGSYVQHSINYHRLALTIAGLALTATRYQSEDLPQKTQTILKRSLQLLHQMQEDSNGELPNYGANDGTYFMHLSTTGESDYRPLIQWLSVLLNHECLFKPGAYDEMFHWFCLNTQKPQQGSDTQSPAFCSPQGGYSILRQPQGHAMIRCHSYQTRPNQADMLHLDLFREHQNIALDGGTFSYYDPQGIGNYLKSTRAHNTVTIDNADQMRPFRRFHWLNWTKSHHHFTKSFTHNRQTYWLFCGEHYGYRQQTGITHRRTVLGTEGDWLVLDDLLYERKETHQIDLYWHLFDAGDWQRKGDSVSSPQLNTCVSISTMATPDIFTATKSSQPTEAIYSRTYGDLNPAFILKAQLLSDRSVRLCTTIGKDSPKLENTKISWKNLIIPMEVDESLPHSDLIVSQWISQ